MFSHFMYKDEQPQSMRTLPMSNRVEADSNHAQVLELWIRMEYRCCKLNFL